MQNYYNIPQYSPPQPQRQYMFVNGVEGAKAYQVMPNQTVMLMDSDSPLVFKKSADAYGRASLNYYKLVEVNEEELKTQSHPTGVYATKEDLDEIRQKIEELSSKLSKEE